MCVFIFLSQIFLCILFLSFSGKLKLDVGDKSLKQVGRAASAPGFLAAIAAVRGLTPLGSPLLSEMSNLAI